jgi:Spx/MgsR family transcriptional regulator
MIHLYGLTNCDSCRQAQRWLKQRAIDYQFHDFSQQPVDPAELELWVQQLGWQALLNKRSTSWRQLADQDKQGLTEEKAIALMLAQPKLIKRPVLSVGDSYEVGFDAHRYQALLAYLTM